MKRTGVLLLLFTSLSVVAGAQEWFTGLDRRKSSAPPNFFELQQAFNEYWKDREPVRGQGYNPFRRWEWLMETRVDSLGRYPANKLWEASLLRRDVGSGSKQSYASWKYIGPDSIPYIYNTEYLGGMGRIDCIEFHPTDTNTFWIGAPTGGVWKTTDAGMTWTPLTDFIPSIGIADIVVHPQSTDTIFIATGDRDGFDLDGIGILRSDDGGLTWKSAGLDFSLSDQVVVNKILINPKNPNIMIAATSRGIYRTTSGGFKWTAVVATGNFKDIEFKTTSPDTLLAGEYRGNSARIFRSLDGGATFGESYTGISISNARRVELATTPANPSLVYALIANLEGGMLGVYRSTNFGQTWSMVTSGAIKNLLVTDPNGVGTGGQGWYDLSLAVSPVNTNEIYVGGINIWKSSNGGASWKLMTFGYPYWEITSEPYVHVDHHALEFQPLSKALFSGNDGGLYKSNSRGVSWTDLSHGLKNLQIYRIGSSSLNPKMVITGNQDNGTFLARENRWAKIYVADGMECIVDYTDTNIIYATTQYGNIYKSYNGAKSWYRIKPRDAASGAWITPYIMHPTDPEILYAGYEDIYMTVNGGINWVKKSNFGLTGSVKVNTLAISPSNPDYVYASSGYRMWRSADGGNTWSTIHIGLPSLPISYITVSQYDPNKVFVTLSGYSYGNRIFRTNNGGLTWENYTANLPDVPVNCVVYENNSNQALYAGTDIGVFYRNRAMSEWVSFNDQLPNVLVNELEMHYGTGKIRAGTYGRGLWESDLYNDLTNPLYAEFTVDRTAACTGSPFTFRSVSTADADSLVWDFGTSASPKISRQDTVPVIFTVQGKKTVKLTVYRGGSSVTETKVDFVNSLGSIKVTVVPDSVFIPMGDTLRIKASGADSYTWTPSDYLDVTEGPSVVSIPLTDVTYTVSGTQGNCTDQATARVRILVNDDRCNPILLAYGPNGPFTNQNATVEPDEPLPDTLGTDACTAPMKWCQEGGLQHTVWFNFVAPSTGVVSIDTRGMDNQIAVYEARECDSLVQDIARLLAANDDYYPQELFYAAAITEIRNLVPGKTYYLQVDGSAGGVQGKFTITLASSPLSIPHMPQDKQGLVRIFPNPNRGSFRIEFNGPAAGKTDILVFNLNGQLVYSTRAFDPEGINIELKNAPPGIYILECITGDLVERRKLVVE